MVMLSSRVGGMVLTFDQVFRHPSPGRNTPHILPHMSQEFGQQHFH
jgi:hypothetical protein